MQVSHSLHGEACEKIEGVIDAIKEIEQKRNSFPFESDGAVIKVNDLGLQQRLGVKTREPRWAIAYKFQAHQGTTKIKEILGSVGRTGVITPFAVFEPVHIGGLRSPAQPSITGMRSKEKTLEWKTLL